MNVDEKLISICIPAYKRPENIDRLLQSISIQQYKDYEIIITDDSPDDSVHQVVQEHNTLPIKYFKNEQALGTPANWNKTISLANGVWIKLMHDDDWFVDENSLQLYADATKNESKFIISKYYNVLPSGKKVQPAFTAAAKEKISRFPMALLVENVIGPPSVTLVHRSVNHAYDERMKWRVDIDFYVSILLQEKSLTVINQPLVNIGISETQVTNDCINKPEVELPEGLLLLRKYGINSLRNIWVYDAWWRILRNVNIRSEGQLQTYTPNESWPKGIIEIIRHQSKLPQMLLKKKVISKTAMFLSYIFNRKNLRN